MKSYGNVTKTGIPDDGLSTKQIVYLAYLIIPNLFFFFLRLIKANSLKHFWKNVNTLLRMK